MLQSETPAHAACTASWALQSLWASAASAVIRSGHSLDRRSTYGDGALRSIRRRLSLAASCSGRLLRERGARLPMLAGWDRGAARRRRRAGTQKEMITGRFLVASRKKKRSGDQGKPGKPGHRNIGRGSCRSALAGGVERRSTAVVRVNSSYPCTPDGGPMGHSARSTVPPPPPHPPLQSASEGIGGARGLGRGGGWLRG